MQHRFTGKPRPKSLSELPTVELTLNPEEFTLLAYAVYHTLSGIHPARESLATSELFEKFTGLNQDILSGEHNSDFVLNKVNRAMARAASELD